MYVGVVLPDPPLVYIAMVMLYYAISPDRFFRYLNTALVLCVTYRDFTENPVFLLSIWCLYLFLQWKRNLALLGAVQFIIGLYYHLKVFA